MAYHLSRRSDDAADLVQETVLRALAAEDRFQLRESGVRPWLFKILHNVFFTRLARVKRGPTYFEEMGETPEQGGEATAPCWDLATLDWEQVDQRLKRAIDELPPHYRVVLLLWAVEGLKYREIAEVTGVAIGTVMSRLSRARALLARPLEGLAREHGIHVLPADAPPGDRPLPARGSEGRSPRTNAIEKNPEPPLTKTRRESGTNDEAPVLT